jgi:hypothetical protein
MNMPAPEIDSEMSNKYKFMGGSTHTDGDQV